MASRYPSLGNWSDWQGRRTCLSLVDVFKGRCIARPPSSSHPGAAAGLVQATVGIILLQGPPLAPDTGKVSAGAGGRTGAQNGRS